MTDNIREERIGQAVCAAAELVSALQAEGPVNPAQAVVLMLAAARAKVPNVEDFEVRDVARRVVKDLQRIKRGGANDNNPTR
jgi:hypothetical protein